MISGIEVRKLREAVELLTKTIVIFAILLFFILLFIMIK